MSIDKLESEILGGARRSYEISQDDEDDAFSALQKRIAAAPLVGLAGLQLPPVPDPTTLASATMKTVASASAAQGTSAAASSVAATVGSASLMPGLTVGLLSVPLKFIAATALVGAVAGAGYGGIKLAQDSRDEPNETALVSEAKTSERLPAAALPSLSRGAKPLPLTEQADDAETEQADDAEPEQSALTLEDLKESKDLARPPKPQKNKNSGPSLFHEELSHLRQAQKALKGGNASLALQLMNTLDHQQRGGALIPERRMTKLRAYCALGRTGEALSIARTVVKSSSGPMYHARIERSCAKAEVSASSLAALTPGAAQKISGDQKAQQIKPSAHTKE